MGDWSTIDTIRASLLAQLHNGVRDSLTLSDRRQLWRLFGAYEKNLVSPFVMISEGLKRRFDLQLGCVLSVLPDWERRYPRVMIDDCINLTLSYLKGHIMPDVLLGHAESKWYEFDDFIDDNNTPISMLGFAAVKLLNTVLYDFDIDPTGSINKTDYQYDIIDREVSFDISRIVAQTATQSQRNATHAVRDYWIWYLTVAVQNAWGLEFQQNYFAS